MIDGATSIKVTFGDGKTYTATIVGSDTSTDVAVLKVNAPASELSPLSLGDSSNVAVGDGVVAIGDPFGLDDTVTSGIVSAVDREIQAPDNTPIDGAIQTDAAINHGNSGGPLFDLAGKVIGVTAQIESDSGGSDGVGFAIPSNLVKTIADQLIATGKAAHPLLGIDPTSATNGVKVASVESGTGAAKAGLQGRRRDHRVRRHGRHLGGEAPGRHRDARTGRLGHRDVPARRLEPHGASHARHAEQLTPRRLERQPGTWLCRLRRQVPGVS